jgi:hypothetical protein
MSGGGRKVVLAIVGVLPTVSSLVLAKLGPATAPIVVLAAVVVAGLSARGWSRHQHGLRRRDGGPAGLGHCGRHEPDGNYVGVMLGPPLFGLLADRTDSYTSA